MADTATKRRRRQSRSQKAEKNVLRQPQPYREAARKGIAWTLIGLGNANVNQGRLGIQYARSQKMHLSYPEFRALLQWSALVVKVGEKQIKLGRKINEEKK